MLIKNHFTERSLWLLLISFACLSSYGWIATYPKGGYFTLLFFGLSFVLFLKNAYKSVLFILITSLFLVYSNFPREYAGPSTGQQLSAVMFFFILCLNIDFRKKVNLYLSKIIILLCVFSLIVQCLLFFIDIPRTFYEVDTQQFYIHWPFYVDRVNISKGSVTSFLSVLFFQRFHGPFFEPGYLGVILGVMLYSGVSGYYRKLIFFFGILTLSMGFFAILSLYLLELKKNKNSIFYLLLAVSSVVLYFFLGDSESFFYRSIFERFFGSGDKVLDTRSSIYELKQISMFWHYFYNEFWAMFFGVGFDVPGSGGSYRVWVFGVGYAGVIASFLIFLKFLIPLGIRAIPRAIVLLLLCYLFGFWFTPFFIFLLEDSK